MAVRRERKREGRIDRCFSLPPNSERESQLLPNVERERERGGKGYGQWRINWLNR